MPRLATGLTGRGWGVLAIGAGLTAGGWFLREPALLWPGLFLTLLPVLSLGAVLAGDPGFGVTRAARPAEVEAGEPVEIEVSLRQGRPTMAGSVLVEERPPRLLGGARTFVLSPPGTGRISEVCSVIRQQGAINGRTLKRPPIWARRRHIAALNIPISFA